MMMTEFGPGNGFIRSRRPSTNLANLAVVNDPSIISTVRIPSRDNAGKMEYLP